MAMNCPRCGSDKVQGLDNRTATWFCYDCGYEGHKADFDPQQPDYMEAAKRTEPVMLRPE